MARRGLGVVMKTLTVDKFLEKVTFKTVETHVVEYNTLVEQGLSVQVDASTYKRVSAQLLRKFWKSIGKRLGKNLPIISHKLGNVEKDFNERLKETAEIELMERFGTPEESFMVISDNAIYVLRPDDFRIYVTYDSRGRAYGALACYNRYRNFTIGLVTQRFNIR
jgi:hypothetical protein